ncbi:site-specific integrase (plasmid) [Embleya sp. NBC_00888]|uniref:tyrosine-type recombinase/integrase n=1 Tax=Embleya sp. NBC_00888 TaxID=2975960 RepID=UPI002F915286|nr:site-specific integrase [Embleya sp. NBC_00888]
MTVCVVTTDQVGNGAGARSPDDLTAWAAWIEGQLDSDWRPGEWSYTDMLFVGDPGNSMTRLNACSIVSCGKPTTAATWCTTCEREQRKSGLSADEFAATFRASERLRSYEMCKIQDCPRTTQAVGLCNTHYMRWFRERVHQPQLDLSVWIPAQRPCPPFGECPVLGCSKERQSSLGLCNAHYRRWKTERRRRESEGRSDACGPDDLAVWLRGEVPLLDMARFSLGPLSDVGRLEMLFVLQARDALGQTIPPKDVKACVKRLTGLESIAFAGTQFPDYAKMRDIGCASILRQVQWHLSVALDNFRGIDPTRKLVWDLRVIGQRIPSLRTVTDRPRHASFLDFSEIRQPWLRDLVMHYGRVASPTSARLHDAHRAAVITSEALDLVPGGGLDPRALGYSDVSAVVDGFKRAKGHNGKPYRPRQQQGLLNSFFQLLEFGRLDGVLGELSPRFSRHKGHSIKALEDNEDEIGKSLPDTVIRQLDEHVHLLGDVPYGTMPAEAVKVMFETAYVVLRDTGRRPLELSGLALDCLEFDEGEYQLIWDNHKGRRLRRRLPIPSETADAIKAWLKVRATLEITETSAEFLFPGKTARTKHMTTGDLWRTLRTWADGIPVLDSDELGPDANFVPFDRSKIYPYAFRHTFCQRYADAGVPLHVLQDLMDHRSPKTTGAYYRVGNRMKRAAMNTLRQLTTDRHGDPKPIASATSYAIGSVAVQYGNCIEPSNVKAGGHACPIRYQCSGCPSFRPDPSHLPAIQDHLRTLKANRELAMAMGAADYTITGMAGEIADYQSVIVKMRAKLERMTDEERAEVEEASRILRKLRAASASRAVALPMPVVSRRDGDRP